LPKIEIGPRLADPDDLSENLLTIPTDDWDAYGLRDFRARLAELETEGAQKLRLIEERDCEIVALENQLQSLKRRQSPRVAKPGTAEFYRLKYEAALTDLESLKASLRKKGKIRTVSARSARPISPKLA
jgi:hypothetical protein